MTKLALLAGTMAAGVLAMSRRDGEMPDRSLTREMRIDLRAEAVSDESRTVELSFSSEAPVSRWWGSEILDHGKKSVRLGRLNDGGALLMDHNTRDQVGVVEKAWVDGKVCRAVVRFGRSERAEEIFLDVKDGIRKLVSVGYNIFEMVLEKSDKQGGETYRITDWEPFEISLVSVPADTNVGVGRDGQPPAFDPRSLIKPDTQPDPDEEDDDMRMTRDANGGVAAPVATQPVAVETRNAPAPVAAAPAVDAAALIREERERAQNIRAIGARIGMDAAAIEAAVNDGQSIDAFVRSINTRVPETQAIRTAESPEIGLTDQEAQRYSFVRLFNAMANPTDAMAQRAARFELECSAAAMSRGGDQRSNGALRIPQDVLVRGVLEAIGRGQRDLNVGTATAGGHTVATDLLAGSFIELLRNRLSLQQVGARMLTDLNGNVAIPRQTGGATAYWVGEGSASTESQQAFDQVALTPKTVTGFTDYSRQLLLQSSIDIESFVRTDLATVLALEIDRAGINGSGSSNQPLGVMGTSGIGSVAGGTNGLAPTWDHIVGLETAVANANADLGAMNYLTNSKVRGRLKRTQKFSSTNGDPIWEAGNEMNGYGAAVSNQVPSNLTKGTSSGVCSAILFGNWADLIIGMWGGLDVLVNPYILSGTGSVRIEVFQSVDVAVRHPESFAAMLDALTV